jgi:pyridoxal phosphate enzyme (YggS family)
MYAPVTPLFLSSASFVERLFAVRKRIADAARAGGREPDSVALLGVSKTFDADAVAQLHDAGLTRFGENYLQEAQGKLAALADRAIEWHFIGPIQRNKTRPIAENFSWVQSVDRLQIAERLAEQRPAALPPLNVLLEINVSGEASKSGVAPDQLAALAAVVASLPRLTLRGLMAIPVPTPDVTAQRAAFARVREAFDTLNADGHALDTLSMGMSNDLEAAIAEGATLVRVGTALFGQRIPAHV